jgi:hypothetical protein
LSGLQWKGDMKKDLGVICVEDKAGLRKVFSDAILDMSKEPMNVPHIRNANIKANFNSWGTVIELAAEPNPVSLDVFIEDFYCLQHIDAKNLRGFWDHCYSLGMAKYRPDYPQPPYNVFSLDRTWFLMRYNNGGLVCCRWLM